MSGVHSSPLLAELFQSPPVTADESPAPAAVAGNDGVGLANPQMSGVRRRMLDLVNELHSTGVQVDIDLPQIAVVGNQSAGKSSLIESISGITLPRASGTCTRCPTECRLSHSSSPWKCTVSLRITTDSQGQPLGQARNEVFGDPIFDKKDVEDRIRRAQLAILNPQKPAKSFLSDTDDFTFLNGTNEGGSLTFSTNCVSLAISGPGVADLSFVDLPGLIASIGRGGNSGDIKLVEGLVTTYIKKSNCIILLTVACETDFENQGAHQLAKQYDPEGRRTIGVLTKPDRIPGGEEQNWLQFIRNEKEPLQNNWFCVKQPSSSDLKNNWTWEYARKKEAEFFAGTSPWNELESMYARYLQTRNLVERLSQVLSELIAKRMPEIQQEIEQLILKTRRQIGLLPKPPPQNSLNEVAKLIKDFDADLRRHIGGVPYKEGIVQQIRVPCKQFRRAVRDSAPEFRPFDRSADRETIFPDSATGPVAERRVGYSTSPSRSTKTKWDDVQATRRICSKGEPQNACRTRVFEARGRRYDCGSI
ncbi:Interferon-induced GTP-binding protein Mx [Leucoagaricus sp. SymC.cos]|nr:Interferon-induced GTP-binding protein Mx [Leucoagaricus sp. SymC.cos]